VSRCVVLFAREPGREAREKGLPGPEGAALFSEFARSWQTAAAAVGARLVVSCPREDAGLWRRRLSEPCRPQRGASFGERVENAARDAACGSGISGHTVLVGGDVPASVSVLSTCFAALEGGAAAVLVPAPDGGVSMVSLPEMDLDLLRVIEPRRPTVFAFLRRSLSARGRRVAVVGRLADVDGRRSLGSLVSQLSPGPLRALARLALRRLRALPAREPSPRISRDPSGLPALRAPPAA
jgi:glycosyltransferase A (GT-A) superfamily protein (DUF2064 family)